MKKPMTSSTAWLWLIAYSILAFNTFAQEIPMPKTARDVATAFIQGEFAYANEYELAKFIKLSPAKQAKFNKNFESLVNSRYTIHSTPLVVVESYQILDIQVEDNKATAITRFLRLARADGNSYKAQHLVVERPHEEIVKLNLIYDGNRWWVIDPPIPRISKEALINVYKARIEENDAWDNPYTKKEVHALKLLKELPSKLPKTAQ